MSMIDLSAKRITGSVVRLNPDDNVVVARIPLTAGTQHSRGGRDLPGSRAGRLQDRGARHRQGRADPQI